MQTFISELCCGLYLGERKNTRTGTLDRPGRFTIQIIELYNK